MDEKVSASGGLTSFEAALAVLLDGLAPVGPVTMPLEQALGRVAAAMPSVEKATPPRDVAVMDGWACRALDLVGASAYTPLLLAAAPAWVETGEAMPHGCDCVIEADLVDTGGPFPQAIGEAAPGDGVRRAGADLTAGRPPVTEGTTIGTSDLLAARAAGVVEIAVRSPRVRVVDVAAANGETLSTRLVAESLEASGATLVAVETVARDAASIGAALDGDACDLIVLVGGTGEGRTDATAEALGQRGALAAHRIALRPSGTAAVGRLGGTPVIALPGLPDHSFAGLLALVQPVLDRLSGRQERRHIVLPLSRKVSSAVGLCEIVLLAHEEGAWMPLAVGEFTLDSMRLADAWLAIEGGSEGYAAGTAVAATPLRCPC